MAQPAACETVGPAGAGLALEELGPGGNCLGPPKWIASGTPNKDIIFHLVPRGEVERSLATACRKVLSYLRQTPAGYEPNSIVMIAWYLTSTRAESGAV